MPPSTFPHDHSSTHRSFPEKPPSHRSQPNYGQDFLASIVVFLVALPLCLGIAIASGAPPALGLLSGIIGGLVVGYFSGAPLQVSGPAAGLVSIVWEIIRDQGLETLGLIIFMAGIIQLAAVHFRLVPMFRAVSPAVVQGMLAGIGIIIFASQVHVMVDDEPRNSAVQNLVKIPSAIYKGIFPMDGTSHHLAAMIGLLTIGIIILWSFLPPKIKAIPAALVAVVIAVGISAFYQLPINYVEIPANLSDSLNVLQASSFKLLFNDAIWISAFTVAFVATAETMLSTTALDRMHSGPRAKYEKEVFAQGIGNTLAGLVGALPITGVVVRSSANITSGATSRASTMFHALWIALIVIFFPQILSMIPIASLAAILVYTGYTLVKPRVIQQLIRIGKSEIIIFAITVAGVVFTNLLEGVLLGFIISSFRLLYVLSRLRIETRIDPENQDVHIHLRGSATFISLPTLSSELERLPAEKSVYVHTSELVYIDSACIDLLKGWYEQYTSNGGLFIVNWESLPQDLSTLTSTGNQEPSSVV